MVGWVVSAEQQGEEWVVLPGSDLLVCSAFTLEADREDGLRLRATVYVEGGRLVCRALRVTSDRTGIDRGVLSGLGLATLFREVASRLAMRRGGPSPEEGSDETRFDAGPIRDDFQRHIDRVRTGGPRRLNDEFLKVVADAYRRALVDREGTATAVARLAETSFGSKEPASEPTARRWIAAARHKGYLNPTAKGQKGA